MKAEFTVSLRLKADEIAVMFSDKERGGNTLGETFTVRHITILSETTACVTFDKAPHGMIAVAFLYHINSRAHARWEYFFVTYSHLVGLGKVADILHKVEQHNFSARGRDD